MKIKITPLSNGDSQIQGELSIGNNFYIASSQSAGVITEIKEGDEWLEDEVPWVSRSEIPFLTAFRHSCISQPQLTANALLPLIQEHMPFYRIKNVEEFPNPNDCARLIGESCASVQLGYYLLDQSPLKKNEIEALLLRFDYTNDFLVRAASCIYKAYCLLRTSFTFSEEIYINTYIALEAIIEFLKVGIESTPAKTKSEVVVQIAEFINKTEPGVDFIDYEEEMRDRIRNNIIHPYRTKTRERNHKPYLLADYIFEDLGFVDWIFKGVIEGQFSS